MLERCGRGRVDRRGGRVRGLGRDGPWWALGGPIKFRVRVRLGLGLGVWVRVRGWVRLGPGVKVRVRVRDRGYG